MKKIIVAVLSTTVLLIGSSANAATKPLNSKENKSSCTHVRTKYQSTVMSNWSNGLATDQDVIKEIDLNINMLSKRVTLSNGKIQTQIKSWLSAERKTKVSLINTDIEGISTAMTLKISSVNKLDKLCKTIGR